MTTTTDAALVEAARGGDAGARDELVRRHQRQIALLAAALVNDPTEAEDLAQETFVRAFRNLDLLVDPSRFAPWLRRIAFGVSIDWLRSFRPDLYRGWDELDDHAIPDAAPSPLDHLLRGEMTERVATALAALPPRYRVPIRLFHLDGLSHAKIAGTLGLPIGTVRSLVARARRRLAPLLADFAPDAASQVDELFAEQPHRPTASMTITTSASSAASASGPSSPSRFLHVANGSSTTGTIREAGIPGLTGIWADVLHEGPVPGGLSDEDLLQIRARHLSDTDERDGRHSHDDVVAELRGWRAAIANHQAYDELILWYEHDLFDQLNLIQLLDRIRQLLPAAKPVSLICIGSFPGRPRFKGLGELTPDELASLLETRQQVNDAQYALAERAWHAFRADDPRRIEDLLGEDTSALPFLAAALRRHLEEFPWTIDGLSRTERRLMALAQTALSGSRGSQESPAATDLHAAFPRMHDDESAFYIADGAFLQIARDLASASPALLAFDPEPTVAGANRDADAYTLPRASITLTDTGRAVLAGTTDRVRLCGLDRWLGGVHLQGTDTMWRWDPASTRIVHG